MAMFLTVPLSPDTMQRLELAAAASGRPDVQLAAGEALKRGAALPEGRILHLSGDVLEKLEGILQGGSLLNQEDLLRKVERLAGVSMLHVRFPFTPGQLEDLTVRAERQGLTVEQLIDRSAGRIYEQFFNLVRE